MQHGKAFASGRMLVACILRVHGTWGTRHLMRLRHTSRSFASLSTWAPAAAYRQMLLALLPLLQQQCGVASSSASCNVSAGLWCSGADSWLLVPGATHCSSSRCCSRCRRRCSFRARSSRVRSISAARASARRCGHTTQARKTHPNTLGYKA
jgi:hypothetical protein